MAGYIAREPKEFKGGGVALQRLVVILEYDSNAMVAGIGILISPPNRC
jgi:hypothetical protein